MSGYTIAEKAAVLAAVGGGVAVAKKVADAVPGLGTAVNVGMNIYHRGEALDARRVDNYDKEDYHNGRSGYHALKAIPVLGTALSVGELASGATNLLTDGSFGGQKDGSFTEGVEGYKDAASDLISMGSNLVFDRKDKYGTIGSHKELRHGVEEADHWRRAREQQEGKQDGGNQAGGGPPEPEQETPQ